MTILFHKQIRIVWYNISVVGITFIVFFALALAVAGTLRGFETPWRFALGRTFLYLPGLLVSRETSRSNDEG